MDIKYGKYVGSYIRQLFYSQKKFCNRDELICMQGLCWLSFFPQCRNILAKCEPVELLLAPSRHLTV